MPYLQLDLDAFPMIEAAAEQLQVEAQKLTGSLAALWLFAWKTEDAYVTRRKLAAITKISDPGLVEALEEYGFIESDGDVIRIRGTKRYSKMKAAKSAAGQASAAKRQLIESTTSATDPQQPSTAVEQPLTAVQRPGGRSDNRDPRSEKRLKKQLLLSAVADAPAPDLVAEVFQIWADRLGHPRSILDEKRRKLLSARVAEGMDLEQATLAIDGVLVDIQNWPDRRRFDGIEYVFESRGSVEKFMDLALKGNPLVRPKNGAWDSGRAKETTTGRSQTMSDQSWSQPMSAATRATLDALSGTTSRPMT